MLFPGPQNQKNVATWAFSLHQHLVTFNFKFKFKFSRRTPPECFKMLQFQIQFPTGRPPECFAPISNSISEKNTTIMF
jgi:hypothetical protein